MDQNLTVQVFAFFYEQQIPVSHIKLIVKENDKKKERALLSHEVHACFSQEL